MGEGMLFQMKREYFEQLERAWVKNRYFAGYKILMKLM